MVKVLEISYTGDICERKEWLKCWKFPILVIITGTFDISEC